jgi:hypothetical protein
MPMTSPRERVEDQHAQDRRNRRDEVRPSGEAVEAAEALGVRAVELHERRDVHQLDQRGDYDRSEGRFGEVFEEAGEEQDRDDGEHRDRQPRELTFRTRRSVHRGLGEAAADHHAARQTAADIGGPQPEQLPVHVDLVPLLGRIGLGRPQSFREPDEHDAERPAEQAEEVRG